MSYVLIFGSSIIFIELFLILNLGQDARALVNGTRESLQMLGRDDIGDEAKEDFVRGASIRMLTRTTTLTLKLLLIAAVIYALYRAAVFARPALEPELTQSLVSPTALAVVTAAAACYVLLRNAVRKRI
jgi:hypothetical protein